MGTTKKFEVITEKKTSIRKTFRGWEAESLTSVNGQTFKIFTMKRSNGVLNSTAMPVEVVRTNGMQSMTFDSDAIFNKTISLVSEKVNRVNEKAVREQHFKALTVFENSVSIGEIQPETKNVPVYGSILFLDGYGKGKGSHGNKHVVYQIEDTEYGIKYLTVELDTLSLESKNYVKLYSEKFGIGTYFESGYMFEGAQNDLNNIIISAKQLEIEKVKKEQTNKIVNENIRASKIEDGKKLVLVPKWAKSIIVADYYQNTSDSQSDYFNASSVKTVYLAFSRTTRNNMSELKNASKLFEPTQNFISCFENPIKGDDKIEEYVTGHHLLPNYFLGTSRWNGWKINKNRYFNLLDLKALELLYIAAADGRYLCAAEE